MDDSKTIPEAADDSSGRDGCSGTTDHGILELRRVTFSEFVTTAVPAGE